MTLLGFASSSASLSLCADLMLFQGLRTKPSILGRLRVLSELICCSPQQVLRFAPFWSVWHSRRQSFKSLCSDLIIMAQNV